MWFNLKFAEEIALKFSQKLFGKSTGESGLKALATLWLPSKTPIYAYAVKANHRANPRIFSSKYSTRTSAATVLGNGTAHR